MKKTTPLFQYMILTWTMSLMPTIRKPTMIKCRRLWRSQCEQYDGILDDEDYGINMNDGPIEYDDFNVPVTVGNFSMDGRHEVFDFIYSFPVNSKKAGIGGELFLFHVPRHWIAPILISGNGWFMKGLSSTTPTTWYSICRTSMLM